MLKDRLSWFVPVLLIFQQSYAQASDAIAWNWINKKGTVIAQAYKIEWSAPTEIRGEFGKGLPILLKQENRIWSGELGPIHVDAVTVRGLPGGLREVVVSYRAHGVARYEVLVESRSGTTTRFSAGKFQEIEATDADNFGACGKILPSADIQCVEAYLPAKDSVFRGKHFTGVEPGGALYRMGVLNLGTRSPVALLNEAPDVFAIFYYIPLLEDLLKIVD